MRLIDADKLLFSLEEWELNETPISTYPKPKEFTADDMQRMIWRTIRDCESAVEEQPTVKAIPIELIEKEMKRLDEDIKWAWYYGNTALDKMEYLKTWLTIKLEDWEKENDTN